MQQRIQLVDIVELFMLDAQAQNFTDSTLRFYEGRLNAFVDWSASQGVTSLQDIDPAHIRRFFTHLQSRDLSSAYVHSHARAIKTLLNFAVRDELLDKSPFDKVKMPRLEKKVLPALTREEVRTVLLACETNRERAIVTFLIDSGVRATEAVQLNVGDVNMRSGEVTVQMGKGQKGRVTFIGAKTRLHLKRYLIERGRPGKKAPLFASLKGGTALTYWGLAQILKRLKKTAGVDGFSAHACRRTFAITCLRGGMSIYALQKLMGHADITVLRQYLDLVKDDLESAHNQASPIDNMF